MDWRSDGCLSQRATSGQWAEWLRAPLEHAVAAGDRALAMNLLQAEANERRCRLGESVKRAHSSGAATEGGNGCTLLWAEGA